MSAVLVEFLGPPGVGKSTVSRVAASQLRDLGLTSTASIELTGYFDNAGRELSRRTIQTQRLKAIASSPRLGSLVYRCWRAEGSGLAMSWMVNLVRRNAMARELRHLDGPLLLEEGPLSALCLASAARRDVWNLLEVLPLLEAPDLVVALRAPAQVTRTRVVERREILAGSSETDYFALRRRYVEAQRLVEEKLTVPVLELSTDDLSASAAASAVARRVLDL